MVIDSSALIAILLGEPQAEALVRAILHDPKRLMSAFSVLESGMVIEAKKGEAGSRKFELLLHRSKIESVPFDAEQYEIALSAWRKYGKGRLLRGSTSGIVALMP